MPTTPPREKRYIRKIAELRRVITEREHMLQRAQMIIALQQEELQFLRGNVQAVPPSNASQLELDYETLSSS
jgi:uncharacterized coiled-coil protein SlyX